MQFTRTFRHFRVALPLLGLALSTRADVLVVDRTAGPGTDFPDIQGAVTAAVEGDTILVRDGAYQMFVIDGKSLSIVADGDAVTAVGSNIFFSQPAVLVRNLAANQQVVIRGFETNSGAAVMDCEGAVWFDEFVATGDVPCSSGGAPGAYVKNSARVTFTQCSLRGESSSDFYFTPHPTADGLHAVSSTVQLFDSVIRGGWGQASSSDPLIGGAGMRLDDSDITIIGCTIQGGEGGLNHGALCTGGNAQGGPGVEFVGASATVRSAASTAVGGVADLDRTCPGQTGPPGVPIIGNGTIVALAGFARHLRANSPVRGGETVTFDLGGVAGELPLLIVSLEHEPIALPAQNGTLLLGLPPANVFLMSPLPAGGETSLAFAVPNIGGVAEGLTYYAQALFLDPTSVIWLGSGTTVVVLDASF